jgi:hypothetical protein
MNYCITYELGDEYDILVSLSDNSKSTKEIDNYIEKLYDPQLIRFGSDPKQLYIIRLNKTNQQITIKHYQTQKLKIITESVITNSINNLQKSDENKNDQHLVILLKKFNFLVNMLDNKINYYFSNLPFNCYDYFKYIPRKIFNNITNNIKYEDDKDDNKKYIKKFDFLQPIVPKFEILFKTVHEKLSTELKPEPEPELKPEPEPEPEP